MDFSSNVVMDKGNKGEILLYQTEDGASKIEVTLSEDTVWLTLDRMAELFQRNKSTISRHIKNIFESGELQSDSTVANFATVQTEGSREVERVILYYNLDVIISVGYRVNSLRCVQFRIWATQVLREYLVKGFALNDDLLKRAGGGNYFAELQAQSHTPMYMKDWIQKLDDFLKLSGRELLSHVGKISAEVAREKASLEYDKFRRRTADRLSPVEIHFLENFERERRKLGNSKP